MDRNASRAGLAFPECPGRAGIAWPEQYVPSHRAFVSTIADLRVYACLADTHPGPCVYDASGLSTFILGFVFLTVFYVLSCQGFWLSKYKRT